MRTDEKPALIAGDVVVSYRELDERSTAVAHGLAAAHGVGPGDRVAVSLPNHPALFVAMVAIGKLDAVMVPINTHLTAAEVRFIVDDSAAKVLLDDPDALPVADGPPLEAAPAPKPMFYTSGTTGRPKGVVHGTLDRARMEMAQQGLVALWGWTQDDVYLLSGPAYHAGPGGYAMSAMYVGATIVILEHFSARPWLEAVARHRGSVSFMVPAHFIRILEVPDEERARYDLSSLRVIIHGAAPCPVDVKRRIMDALAPAAIWELYGMSEGGATRISPDEWRAKPGSVGTPWPGVEVDVLDTDGNPVPAGTDGLIYVRPAGGARFEYHQDADKTAAAWRDRAFTVGDVGRLDDDGYLYVTDRAADMVIRGGVNVYPREVEEVLHQHPAVVDCAVFGIPDERDGEHLKAMVELRAPAAAAGMAEELIVHCRAHLAKFKCPDEFEFVDNLPRDDAGKVRKRLLRDAHWTARSI